MGLRNTQTSYGSVAKFFHAVIALLVIAMLVFGFFLEDVPKDYQGFAYNVHKLTGIAILFLMVLRLMWALVNPKPVAAAGTKPWERSLEKAVHFLLYFLVILMPLAGWVGSAAAGRPPHLGSFEFNLLIPVNEALSSAAFVMHGQTAFFLIALISLHVLAALFHHFVKKDNILMRMMPGK